MLKFKNVLTLNFTLIVIRSNEKGVQRQNYYRVASNIGNRLSERALAGKASGLLVDLSFPIKEDISLSVIKEDTEEGLEILCHSTAHIMAQAVSRLFPGVKLGIGPTIEKGFYYDFGLQHSLSDEDLKKIEED